MQKKLPLKIIAAIVLFTLLVWWFLASNDENQPIANEAGDERTSTSQLVSAVQPITESEMDGVNQPSETNIIGSAHSAEQAGAPGRLARNHAPETQRTFTNATRAIVAGDYQRAKVALSKLIKHNPNLTEAYVNLAAVHARQGNLDKARRVLVRGIDANPAYNSVFGSLQQLHSTMAAKAYQLALSEETDVDNSVTAVELPLITQLTISEPPPAPDQAIMERVARAEQEIEAARKQVLEYQSQVARLQSDNQALLSANSEIEGLKEQLSRNQQLVDAGASQDQIDQAELAELRERLSETEQQLVRLRESNAAEVAALQQQLDSQNSLIASAQTARAQQDRLAKAQQEADRRAEQEKLAAANRARQSAQQKREQAIARVQSWAKAWSDQNVAAYINHYRDGYTPPNSSMSHQSWREQRRVRLTNKPFIEVNLKDFRIRDDGERLAVTFSQHYRSNTLNDTITKRLVLQSNDGDWSKAKIISERVVRS